MDIKRFYAIQCKKFLALSLSLVCLVTTVLSPSIVLADNDSYVFKPEYTKIQGLMDYVMSGVMGVFPGDFNTFYQNNKQAYDDWYNKVYGYNYSGSDHSGGGKNLTVKADDMKELYDLASEKYPALDGYYLIEPDYASVSAYLSSKRPGLNQEQVSALVSFCNNNAFYVYRDFIDKLYKPNSYIECGFIYETSQYIIAGKNLNYMGFSSSGKPYTGTSVVRKFADTDLYYFSVPFNKSTSWISGHPYKLFYSYSDYLKWLQKDNSSVYFSSNFYNYSPHDITINSETVKNYTVNNTTEKIYNETVNNINQFGGTSVDSGLTQEQVQKIVDDAVQKVLDAMPTPTPELTDTPTPTPTPGTGTGTDTPTPTPTPGGDPGGTPDSSTKEFFQKICDYFEENNKKLEDIINLLDTAGKSDCNYNYSELSDFLSTLWNESDKKFDTMISLLEKNNVYQEKMLDSLNQIKALLVVDSVLDVFKDRSTETANKAKEKFPTSVPWDVAMIVNAMSAEPQAPVMKIPLVLEQFGISEEVTIDLSSDEWEKLAKLCRYLLSLLFLLFMVHLTRKLFYKDGDD